MIKESNDIRHAPLRKSKKLLSYFIDYFVVVIITTILNFLLVNVITPNFSTVKANSKVFYESYQTNEKIIQDSKLGDFNLESYTKMLIKASLDETKFPGTTYHDIVPLTSENDPIKFYYFEFKNNNLKDYDNGLNYEPGNYLLKYKNSDFFINKNNDFYVLKKDVALILGDQIFNRKNIEKAVSHESINIVKSVYDEAATDLKIHNIKYKETSIKLEKAAIYAKNLSFVNLSIGFCITFILYFLVVPSLNKKHITLSQKILNYRYVKSDNVMKISNLLLLNSLRFFASFSSIILAGFMSLGITMSQIFMVQFNSFYYGIFLVLASLLFFLSDLISIGINKRSLTLSELFLRVETVDELEVIKNDR